MPEQTGGEKTLPASPRKIQKAREQGNVARSQDLGAAVSLSVALLGLWLFGPFAGEQMLALTNYYFSEAHLLLAERASMQSLMLQALTFSVPAALPLMLLLLVAGVAANLTQVGFLVAPQAVQPKIERLNPITGFQRFISVRGLVELLKSLAKLAIVGWIAWVTLVDMVPQLLNTMHQPPAAGGMMVWDMTLTIWWRVVLAMIAIGLLDFAYQRYQYGRDNMMTVQEARDELKELEGDPRIKQRVRQIQRQMAMQRMMAEVPEAEVVITNPTHYAVALRYNPARMDAPTVVAKGTRRLAERIREIAVEYNVPIVQRPDLARTLYQSVEVGQAVPETVFRAVAEVLAFVYEIDRREQKIRERAQQPVMARAV